MRRCRRPAALPLAALALAAAAPGAHAATVEAVSGVAFSAAAGEANRVTVVASDPLTYTVEDLGAPLEAGSGCTQTTVHGALCTLPADSQPRLGIDLGDGDDELDLSGIDVGAACPVTSVLAGDGADSVTALGISGCGAAQDVVAGGGGADVLAAGSSPVTLNGDAGADVLTGSRADDVLAGGSGDDLLDGRAGSDRLDGGDGSDTVDYSRRSAAVFADLASGEASGGESGEQDTIGGSENVTGGSGDDTLRGGAGANVLAGGPGDDRLDGRAGADRLVGGPGFDIADYSSRTESLRLVIADRPVSGGAGDGPDGVRDRIDETVEQLIAGSGDDVLTGSAEDNVLDGGPGADVLNGGGGEDAADYSARSEPVALDDAGRPTSGGALDGPEGARDTIMADVEDLWGGSGNDTLTGSAAGNLLDGGPGADVLTGGGGEDAADYSERTTPVIASLDGTPTSGNDEDGPEGARDTLGTDIEDLFGGAGPDMLTGNRSRNYLAGQAGDDLLDARGPGGDYADCGAGDDVAWVAPDDVPASDCERIGAGPDVAGPGAAGDRLPPQVRISLLPAQRLGTVVAAGLAVHFTCSETCSLDARLLLGRSGARRLGLRLGPSRLLAARTPARREGPGQGTFTLTLSRRVAARLRAVKRADFRLVVKGRDASGNLARVARRLQLLPGKARLARGSRAAARPFRLLRGRR